jgi:hypothetical protein
MAYTKYSLTPANNTAAPPDGAPEGMLPSAVNDTMRDMMAQIRDCGDGIRDGTYTMTAPKITGGTITGVTLTGNTFSNPTVTGVSTFAAGTVSAPAITTSGDTNTGIYFPAADTIAFTEGGAEAMRIDSSGNVGIGTSNPATKLGIDFSSAGTTIAGSPVFTLKNTSFTNNCVTGVVAQNSAGGNAAGIDFINVNQVVDGSGASGSIGLWTNASGTKGYRIYADQSGNVGIGTSSPAQRLHVASSSATYIQVQNTGNSVNAYYGVDTGGGWMGTSTNHYAAFYTNNTERMRIDSSGRALFGTSTAVNNSYRLSVSNALAGGIIANASGGGDANFVSTSTGILYHFYAESTTAKFYVANNGTISSTNTAVQAISDARHKENVKDLETGLSEVMALKPRRFDWKEGKGTGEKNVAGFIAQEVEYVLPDLIGDWKEELNTDTTFKSLAMGNMIPTLVKAIQELKAELDSVKAELQTLKGS